MGDLVGERERDRKREGGLKQMCQNCIPTMNMNTLWNDDRFVKKQSTKLFCNLVQYFFILVYFASLQ